jgi:hypothetical protein
MVQESAVGGKGLGRFEFGRNILALQLLMGEENDDFLRHWLRGEFGRLNFVMHKLYPRKLKKIIVFLTKQKIY